jgi:hypothetical protein
MRRVAKMPRDNIFVYESGGTVAILPLSELKKTVQPQ